jgi:hypothetical protein
MSKVIVTFGLIIGMCALAITDAVLIAPQLPIVARVTSGWSNSTATGSVQTSSQSSIITKEQSIDVLAAAQQNNIETFDTTETFFLPSIVLNETVNTRSLVNQNDRLGSIAWFESSDVKQYYLALKESLHSNFTTAVQDLQDETIRRAGNPVINQLTFYDAGISNERLVFLRVRDRLYELRVVVGKEQMVQPFIDALSQ